MSGPLRVLVVEDSQPDAELMLSELRRAAYEPDWVRVEAESEYLAQLDHDWDIILSDYSLPQFSGPRAVELLKHRGLDIPIIIVSGTIGADKAVAAVTAGATDYVLKQQLDRLGPVVLRALTQAEERRKQRRAEEALRESEAQYRGLFENAIMGISQASPDGRLINVNQAYAEMYGYSNPAAMMADAPDVNHRYADPSDRNEVLRILGESGVMQPKELTVARRDGSRFEVLVAARAIRDSSGTLLFYQAEHVDINERKRAETALRDSEERFRSLYECSRDAIMIIEPPSWKFSAGNPATVAMFGAKSEADLVSHTPADLSPDRQPDMRASAEKAQDMVGIALREGSHQFEWTHRRLGGEEFATDVLLTRVDLGDKVILQATVRDITERRMLEAQYRQAQKMECVGQLASGIAHDFNNLLSVIIGMSELVLSAVGEDDPMHADVEEIQHAGERAAALTRQLLTFSRQQILETQVLNVNTVVTGMESLLRRLLGEDVTLVVRLAPDTGRINADPGQIEQVVSNLAVNARDAMPQGGQLTIETQKVTIDHTHVRQRGVAVPPGSYVQLIVTDSGDGMDEATRQHIYEPFFTTKGPGQGTGLGLSTVYGIVTQSHGFIWFDSEVGKGTSFKILLPQVTEAADTVKPGPTVALTTGTETILLAEDNAGLRKVTTRVLEPAGYTVLAAATAEEALVLLERHQGPVHLLITDVVMPGMNGRHLAEHLALTRPNLKVLYMSGYTSDTIVRHGVLEAEVPFLHKPITGAALLMKVRGVLDS